MEVLFNVPNTLAKMFAAKMSSTAGGNQGLKEKRASSPPKPTMLIIMARSRSSRPPRLAT